MESIVAQPKIHFYEYMEIQILNQYIQTGIEYMVKSILNSNDKLIPLRYWSQQIATLISAIKDIYFLIRHKAIYAQNFYGLERVNKRSKASIVCEVLVWIVLPYLFRKLEQKYIKLKQDQNNGVALGLTAKVYLKVFPVCFCLIKIVSTVMKFRYLIDSESKFYNLEYFVGKTQLGYIDQEQPSPFPIMSFLKSPGLFVLLVAHKIASYAFSSQQKTKNKEETVQIQAPVIQKKQKECPICGKNFKNPAVLRSSGYVFCYNCIVPEVKSHRKCPVTQIPCDENQIQIIYE